MLDVRSSFLKWSAKVASEIWCRFLIRNHLWDQNERDRWMDNLNANQNEVWVFFDLVPLENWRRYTVYWAMEVLLLSFHFQNFIFLNMLVKISFYVLNSRSLLSKLYCRLQIHIISIKELKISNRLYEKLTRFNSFLVVLYILHLHVLYAVI